MPSSLYTNATMFSGGLSTAWGWAQYFIYHGALTAIAIIAAVLFQSQLGGIIAAWPFFTRRYDFIKSNFQKTTKNVFPFKIRDVRFSYVLPISQHLFWSVAFHYGNQGRRRA